MIYFLFLLFLGNLSLGFYYLIVGNIPHEILHFALAILLWWIYILDKRSR